LSDVIRAQITLRQQQVFATPLRTLDDALGQEFLKGEGVMGEMLLRLPETMLENFQVTLTRENEDDTSGN
jgi:hypothetical protein